MANKTVKNSKSSPVIKDQVEKERLKQLAEVAISPSINAAAVVTEFGNFLGEQDIVSVMNVLMESSDKLKANDMTRCENMLFAQAHALQTMFAGLSRRAINQEYIKNLEVFMRMALKAQNQCRMTLETLAAIKNPPIVYAKQANINHGNQQVNNGVPSPSRAEKNKTSPNELLEDKTYEAERLDTRAPRKAGSTDQAMAAVEKSHRRKHNGR